jgi:hypothetical protein
VQHLLEYIERLVNMSRVFRRPMFRKGGGVNMNGIMSGIEDRQQFKSGSIDMNPADTGFQLSLPQRSTQELGYDFNFAVPTFKRSPVRSVGDIRSTYEKELLEAAGDRGGFDPLTTFLLQYGPQAATQTGGGGLIGNLVAAAKDPVDTLIKDKRDEDAFLRGIRTKAAGAAITTKEDQDKMAMEIENKIEVAKADVINKGKELQNKIYANKELTDAERDNLLTQLGANRKLALEKLEIQGEQLKDKIKSSEKIAEMSIDADKTTINDTIEEEAKQLVKEDPVLTYSEAKNQKTWQYETSGKLMDQGYKIANELLVESIVNDPKKFTQKAKKLSKKPGNEGRIFYFPKGDQYFILEGGAFKPFELPGAKKDNSKETLKKTNNVTEEVDGITNYEYGTGDKRDQTRDIRQKISKLKGPINNPNRLYDTSMNKGQKSAYERYLSDYRNQ